MIGDALEDEPEIEIETVDDLLPIEEEFQNEFMLPGEDNSEPAIQEESVDTEKNITVGDDSETSLIEDLKELIDEGIISEEILPETEPVSVEKELLKMRMMK